MPGREDKKKKCQKREQSPPYFEVDKLENCERVTKYIMMVLFLVVLFPFKQVCDGLNNRIVLQSVEPCFIN